MRRYTEFNTGVTAKLLEQLADRSTAVDAYRAAMEALGNEFAEVIAARVPALERRSVRIACTVEDADFLAKGIVNGLLRRGFEEHQIRFACFWNARVRPLEMGDGQLDIAPILKQYTEPFDLEESVLIIVKSIISGACVVKTNLSTLLEKTTPSAVFVVAPVMLEEAKQRLAEEFDSRISDRFEYLTFAVDDEMTSDGFEVVPGVGGVVYKRLGLGDQTEKNKFVPEIVKNRRRGLKSNFVHV